jgi:hypothetical protein
VIVAVGPPGAFDRRPTEVSWVWFGSPVGGASMVRYLFGVALVVACGVAAAAPVPKEREKPVPQLEGTTCPETG